MMTTEQAFADELCKIASMEGFRNLLRRRSASQIGSMYRNMVERNLNRSALIEAGKIPKPMATGKNLPKDWVPHGSRGLERMSGPHRISPEVLRKHIQAEYRMKQRVLGLDRPFDYYKVPRLSKLVPEVDSGTREWIAKVKPRIQKGRNVGGSAVPFFDFLH